MVTHYKVAKSAKVRSTKHNNIDRAIDKARRMTQKTGYGYKVYYLDQKGFWLPKYFGN